MPILKNTQRTLCFSLLSLDGTENATAVPTCQVALDAGDFALCANAAVRKVDKDALDTGSFDIVLPAAEMNADVVTFRATAAGCVPVVLELYPEADWTATRAGYVDAAVSSTLTQQEVADALKLAPVAGAPAAGSVQAAVNEIGAAGAGLTALGDARVANLNATVSSRSTYAGGAVASVTGDVGGKVLGAGASALTGTGVRAVDAAGNNVAPAADTTEILTRLPDASPGGAGGLPTVDASNKIAGVQGDTPQTGDAYARLGAPAGASVSEDITTLPNDILDSAYAGHTAEGSVGEALLAARALQGKMTISGNLLTFYAADGVTVAFQFTLAPSGGPYVTRTPA